MEIIEAERNSRQQEWRSATGRHGLSKSPGQQGLAEASINWRSLFVGTCNPKAPSTAQLRVLAPKAIPGMVFGSGILKWTVYGPFG